MYIIFVTFITLFIGISRSAPIETTKTKKLMPIDLSKLSNELHGSSISKFADASNIMKPSQHSKMLNVDLSALRIPTFDSIKPKEDNSLPIDNPFNHNQKSFEDFNQPNSFENEIPDTRYDEYVQPLRIIPHNLYFNLWTPEIPGNDALTDFLHEEYKNGRLVSNGKRDFTSLEWEDNEIPIFNDQTKPCVYDIPKEYGINCEDFMKLINHPMHYIGNGNLVKRNMFRSMGWGPSGSHINIPSKIGAKTSKDNVYNKSQRNRQKQGNRKSNDHRWSVPHLFGSY